MAKRTPRGVRNRCGRNGRAGSDRVVWNVQRRPVMVGASVVVERSVVRIVDSGVLNDEETPNEEDEEDEDEDTYRLEAKERGFLRSPDDD